MFVFVQVETLCFRHTLFVIAARAMVQMMVCETLEHT